MAIDSTTAPPVDSRLDDLYWNTDRTIDDIVDELDLSRSTLYASISPVPAGATCPTCSGMLYYTNRMNRAARVASCESCGLERELDDFEAEDRPWVGNGGSPSTNGASAIERWREELGEVEPRRAALIGGAAALGVMLGAAAVRTLRS